MSDVPMTRPQEVLAEHMMPSGHSTSWVDLGAGQILMTAGPNFYRSEDGGLTWSQPFAGRNEDGSNLSASCACMVRLNDGALGLAHIERNSDRRGDTSMVFKRSTDGGETWSKPVRMNRHLPAQALQDVFLRTSSGRLILPVYISLGQGTHRAENAPFVGGYHQGQFVSTDAHYVDPHFSVSYCLLSDDDGKTWGAAEGELHIKTAYNGQYEYANEPSVAEVAPGKLIIVVRNRLGRLFQAWSEDDGTTWSRLQPTALASSTAPAQIRSIPANGHLLIVWNQETETEIQRGLIRMRVSSAISRNGGGAWEFLQNVESLLEGTHVFPGPIRPTLPAQVFDDAGKPAHEIDPQYLARQPSAHLPERMGRMSYPSVLVCDDRVLVIQTFQRYDQRDKYPPGGSRLKVLPLSWFYGGADPLSEQMRTNPTLEKVWRAAHP